MDIFRFRQVCVCVDCAHDSNGACCTTMSTFSPIVVTPMKKCIGGERREFTGGRVNQASQLKSIRANAGMERDLEALAGKTQEPLSAMSVTARSLHRIEARTP